MHWFWRIKVKVKEFDKASKYMAKWIIFGFTNLLSCIVFHSLSNKAKRSILGWRTTRLCSLTFVQRFLYRMLHTKTFLHLNHWKKRFFNNISFAKQWKRIKMLILQLIVYLLQWKMSRDGRDSLFLVVSRYWRFHRCYDFSVTSISRFLRLWTQQWWKLLRLLDESSEIHFKDSAELTFLHILLAKQIRN